MCTCMTLKSDWATFGVFVFCLFFFPLVFFFLFRVFLHSFSFLFALFFVLHMFFSVSCFLFVRVFFRVDYTARMNNQDTPLTLPKKKTRHQKHETKQHTKK